MSKEKTEPQEVRQEEYLKFLAELEKRHDMGLDTDGYTHTNLMWLGWCMAKESEESK